MGIIFGLYSTRDGQIRYIGQTEYTSSKSLDRIITRALDQEEGTLYDWVRDEWRTEHEVRTYVLQDGIIPTDLEMFETYWIEQFASLLNNTISGSKERSTSKIGQRINTTILAQINGSDATKE